MFLLMLADFVGSDCSNSDQICGTALHNNSHQISYEFSTYFLILGTSYMCVRNLVTDSICTVFKYKLVFEDHSVVLPSMI